MSSTSTARLTDELWGSIEGIYDRIVTHPFLTELVDGTLDERAFQHYIVQDTLYIREYARVHSIAAGRAESSSDMLRFNQLAADIVEAEQTFHADFFRDWGLSDDDVWTTPLAPTNLAYTSYMLSVAYAGTFAESVGVVLPCAWVYLKVGTQLAASGSANPLYQRWIDLYAGEEYEALVADVLGIADRLGETLGEAERERVRRHFVTGSRFEWMFWDMGYRREQWPV
ncbi:MAG: thiaminase II [Gaiellales bacterium]